MRNLFCPHYSQCLDEAVRRNLPSVECSGCEHRFEAEPLTAIEFFKCCLLFAAIFRPEVLKEYLDSARQEAQEAKSGAITEKPIS